MTRRIAALLALLAVSLAAAPAPADERVLSGDRGFGAFAVSGSVSDGRFILLPSEIAAIDPGIIGAPPATVGAAPIFLGALETVATIEVQDGATGDLDVSTIVLLPNPNRKKIYLLAHPDNTDAVHVRLIPTSAVFKASAAVGDASANATTVANAADATAANSGIYLGSAGSSFDEDASGGVAWRGAVTAIGAAAGQKLIVLAY